MKQPREIRPSWFVHISKSPKKKTTSKHSQVFSSKKISPKTKTTSKKLPGFFSEETSFLSHDVFFLHPLTPFSSGVFPRFSRCPSPEMDGRCKGPHHRRHNLNFCCLKMEEKKLTAPGWITHHTSQSLGVEKPWKWFGLSKFGFFRRFSLFQLIFRWSILKKLQAVCLNRGRKKRKTKIIDWNIPWVMGYVGFSPVSAVYYPQQPECFFVGWKSPGDELVAWWN